MGLIHHRNPLHACCSHDCGAPWLHVSQLNRSHKNPAENLYYMRIPFSMAFSIFMCSTDIECFGAAVFLNVG